MANSQKIFAWDLLITVLNKYYERYWTKNNYKLFASILFWADCKISANIVSSHFFQVWNCIYLINDDFWFAKKNIFCRSCFSQFTRFVIKTRIVSKKHFWNYFLYVTKIMIMGQSMYKGTESLPQHQIIQCLYLCILMV